MIATPNVLIERLPQSKKNRLFLQETRQTIRNILSGQDRRLLLIVGPCSIHDVKGALEYAKRLKNLQSSCPSLFLVMRTYFEKARSSFGWKGLLYDPFLDGTHQVEEGLRLTRRFLIDLANQEIPAACEFLEPAFARYMSDLISWGCIGARTVTSQIHRQLASQLDMPVGFKNTPEGSIEAAINAIATACQPQTFLGINDDGKIAIQRSEGNPYSHLVLRGSQQGPNYATAHVSLAFNLLEKMDLPQRVIIDCSHDNSAKKADQQPMVFSSVIQQVGEGNAGVRGAMLESYLLPKNQPLQQALQYGVSITDECLSWEQTENLLLWAENSLHIDNQNISSSLKCATV
ncbi:MAG: 3-deoxy-7-phosphoheptulonate synthase [Parachlamydiaceae bacterium]